MKSKLQVNGQDVDSEKALTLQLRTLGSMGKVAVISGGGISVPMRVSPGQMNRAQIADYARQVWETLR